MSDLNLILGIDGILRIKSSTGDRASIHLINEDTDDDILNGINFIEDDPCQEDSDITFGIDLFE